MGRWALLLIALLSLHASCFAADVSELVEESDGARARAVQSTAKMLLTGSYLESTTVDISAKVKLHVDCTDLCLNPFAIVGSKHQSAKCWRPSGTHPPPSVQTVHLLRWCAAVVAPCQASGARDIPNRQIARLAGNTPDCWVCSLQVAHSVGCLFRSKRGRRRRNQPKQQSRRQRKQQSRRQRKQLKQRHQLKQQSQLKQRSRGAS